VLDKREEKLSEVMKEGGRAGGDVERKRRFRLGAGESGEFAKLVGEEGKPAGVMP